MHSIKFKNNISKDNALSMVDLRSREPTISEDGEELTFEDVPDGKRLEQIFDMSDPSENFIHQIDYFTENDSRPKLLIIHGFGSCGVLQYNVIGRLLDKYRVTTIDMLGLGASGRPPFDLKNSLDCIDYYMYSIEAWMKTVGYKTEEYFLMGHSLGGYLSTLYSLKYPKKIKKLILFSPVGVPIRPDNKGYDAIVNS